MSGFYLMHRGWQDNDFFGSDEYSERDAWCWLIENAAWKDSTARVKGETIGLERGQLSFAQRFLATKWRWSKSRVDRFMKRLAAEGMISLCSKNGATAGQGTGQGQSIITICNYADYQDKNEQNDKERGNDNDQTGPTAGQQRGKEEQINNKTKNIKNEDPDWLPQSTWADFEEYRRKVRKPLSDRAKELAIQKLSQLRDQGHKPEAVINQSIMNGWSGLFAVKVDHSEEYRLPVT